MIDSNGGQNQVNCESNPRDFISMSTVPKDTETSYSNINNANNLLFTSQSSNAKQKVEHTHSIFDKEEALKKPEPAIYHNDYSTIPTHSRSSIPQPSVPQQKALVPPLIKQIHFLRPLSVSTEAEQGCSAQSSHRGGVARDRSALYQPVSVNSEVTLS